MATKGIINAIRYGTAIKSIPLRDYRPSTTRSDALSGPLHAANLGIPRLVAELEALLHATRPMTLMTKIPGQGKASKEIEVPDYRTRLEAARMLTAIHGYQYVPQKAQDQDPLVVVINKLPEQVREKLLQTVTNRLLPLTSEGHES